MHGVETLHLRLHEARLVLARRAVRVGEWMIIADAHLGYAQRFPLTLSILRDIDGIHASIRAARKALGMPSRLVIAGDVLDDFALRDARTRWRVVRLINQLREEWEEVMLLRGNHDPMLKTMPFQDALRDELILTIPQETAEEKGEVRGEVRREEGGKRGVLRVLVVHGHALPGTRERVDGIILGHEHPSVRVSDGLRSEKYAAYVAWEHARILPVLEDGFVLLLPAFHPDVEGSDLEQGFQSPLLQGIGRPTRIILLEQDLLFPL